MALRLLLVMAVLLFCLATQIVMSYATRGAGCTQGQTCAQGHAGEEIIPVVPWDEWWELALKDSSNPQIALLPLHPELRANFNSMEAWEYAQSLSGKPYGYHNMMFSWIDTMADNYPPRLDTHLPLLRETFTLFLWGQVCSLLMLQICGMKLSTSGWGLDLYEILIEIENHEIAFDNLLTIPEQDEGNQGWQRQVEKSLSNLNANVITTNTVRKGDIVGVYKSFGDCQAQLSSSGFCTLEFDGASKGNPGLAGAGAVLRADDGSLICELHEGLGVRTNNVAEYRALILGLKYALKKGFTKIRVKGDSKLVCMQGPLLHFQSLVCM
ncbi:hypothetical protein L3X38_005361 [Prunus dulcis]|uniref:RNase H type-1 domain-containing protein n=1 Tax=Prunus dulcis TaxID=3755 RepID=A0AAD4ZQS6_PRUDU|nr:hypothetical protein L3X38_005361 [Prunus dulcis]